MRKTRKVKGYIRVGSRYVSRAFLFGLSTALLAAMLVYALGIHPGVVRWWISRQPVPEFSVLSSYLSEYTGKARLLKPDGTLVYEGAVEEGVVTGKGRLYENGTLLYEGDFLENQYAGIGTLYSRNGVVYYKGNFEANVFHGQGLLYEDGFLLYRGGFSEGLYDGDGTLYHDGSVCYKGGFAEGLFDGEGTEYDPKTGYPIFSGKYQKGERMQAGTEYGPDGKPLVSPEPLPESSPEPSPEPSPGPPIRLNPLSLFGFAYTDVLTALTEDSVIYKEQLLEDRHLVIDEDNYVLYAFTLSETGLPASLSEVYLCGLASAGGLVVGAKTDVTGLEPTPSGLPEVFALGLSNAYWGIDVNETQGGLTETDLYELAVFWSDDPLPSETETSAETTILFLRVRLLPEQGK